MADLPNLPVDEDWMLGALLRAGAIDEEEYIALRALL